MSKFNASVFLVHLLWQRWVFMCRLFLVAVSGGSSLAVAHRFLTVVPSHVAEHDPWGMGASEVRQEGSLAVAQV